MVKIALKIRTFGDPVLRRRSRKVLAVTDAERGILSAMAQIMYDSSGIGLAAPQVGIAKSMIVVDAGTGLYKLVNPRVVRKSGSQALEEGCLSVPGVCIKVKRGRRVTVKALDQDGRPVTIEAQDLLACVLQHEIDHLRGKLIVDYASFLDKLKIGKKLADLQKKAADERLSQPETKSCAVHL